MSRVKEFVFGKPKNPLDPTIFHNLSLVAFFAWIGLGADGLSSSCYGPEEAFLTLGPYTHLAIFLGIAVAATVFILSASYSQIIELFPAGGGGYLVATKLIGPIPGLISGCALLVDYILTVAISIASAADAIFSFLPPHLLAWKFATALLLLGVLLVLNLRGVKESVLILTPIFLTFVITHVVVVYFGVTSPSTGMVTAVRDAVTQTRDGIHAIGFFAMAVIFMRAFCLGGGTFTGIEAVSNSLQILREPRVATGKRTMLYMAFSLAFTAGGILVSYLLFDIHHTPGVTLNAALVAAISRNWPFGRLFTLVTLLSEGALLVVAAQAGFLGGPSVMANMAVDNWLPRRFKNLSDRLVVKDSVLMIGLAAAAMLVYTHASVRLLVVMYSINVFLTFTLSQFGMVRHWWTADGEGRSRKLLVNVTGLVLTAGILVATAVIKFSEGGWVTMVITGGLTAFCFWVHHHYGETARALRHLDEILTGLPLPEMTSTPPKLADQPTAVLMVNGYNGMGVHSFLEIHKSFPRYFKNFVFLSVGVIDADRFKGPVEMRRLEESLKSDLDRYVDLANRMGFYAEAHMVLGTDVTDGLQALCRRVRMQWAEKMFFTGQLVFEKETRWNRLLHNQTVFTIQRRLLFSGLHLVILPLRVRLSPGRSRRPTDVRLGAPAK